MDNDENQIIEEQNCKCDCKKNFFIAFMAFLGSFLAFYVLMHQTVTHVLMSPYKHVMRAERELMRDLDKDTEIFKYKPENGFKNLGKKISAVQTIKNESEYIIFVDLKRFNNDEKNINFAINDNVITISGSLVKNKKSREVSYYFNESFEVPEKINVDEIKKEKVDNKYIITIPIEN